MQYVSTRGQAPVRDFSQVLLEGLASDGGLYVPDTWPAVSHSEIAQFAGLRYQELAVKVLLKFVGDTISPDRLSSLVEEAYSSFDDIEIAPLRRATGNLSLLELYHGPTLAFKDYALQVVAKLIDYFLRLRNRRVTILTATSGDTGAAAISACRGLPTVDVFVLHPHNRISEVQRCQMTTVDAENVHNIAIEGSFDDCQSLVKELFADISLRQRLSLNTLNSINWGRIVGQTVYYFASAAKLDCLSRSVAFSVPTGNFGDVYSGYVAHRMGLPIKRLIVATNENDILHRFFTRGKYQRQEVKPTRTSCMDIQAASNFERLLFELLGRNGDEVASKMEMFARSGAFSVTGDQLGAAKRVFWSANVDERETLGAIVDFSQDTGIVVDPHTAVGVCAARKWQAGGETADEVVCLATAHPAKFPESISAASRELSFDTPTALAGITEKPEKKATVIQANRNDVRDHILTHSRFYDRVAAE